MISCTGQLPCWLLTLMFILPFITGQSSSTATQDFTTQPLLDASRTLLTTPLVATSNIHSTSVSHINPKTVSDVSSSIIDSTSTQTLKSYLFTSSSLQNSLTFLSSFINDSVLTSPVFTLYSASAELGNVTKSTIVGTPSVSNSYSSSFQVGDSDNKSNDVVSSGSSDYIQTSFSDVFTSEISKSVFPSVTSFNVKNVTTIFLSNITATAGSTFNTVSVETESLQTSASSAIKSQTQNSELVLSLDTSYSSKISLFESTSLSYLYSEHSTSKVLPTTHDSSNVLTSSSLSSSFSDSGVLFSSANNVIKQTSADMFLASGTSVSYSEMVSSFHSSTSEMDVSILTPSLSALSSEMSRSTMSILPTASSIFDGSINTNTNVFQTSKYVNTSNISTKSILPSTTGVSVGSIKDLSENISIPVSLTVDMPQRTIVSMISISDETADIFSTKSNSFQTFNSVSSYSTETSFKQIESTVESSKQTVAFSGTLKPSLDKPISSPTNSLSDSFTPFTTISGVLLSPSMHKSSNSETPIVSSLSSGFIPQKTTVSTYATVATSTLFSSLPSSSLIPSARQSIRNGSSLISLSPSTVYFTDTLSEVVETQRLTPEHTSLVTNFPTSLKQSDIKVSGTVYFATRFNVSVASKISIESGKSEEGSTFQSLSGKLSIARTVTPSEMSSFSSIISAIPNSYSSTLAEYSSATGLYGENSPHKTQLSLILVNEITSPITSDVSVYSMSLKSPMALFSSTSSYYFTESESVSSVMTSYQSEISSRSKSFTIPTISTSPTSSDFLTESESVSSVITSYQSEILPRSKSFTIPISSTSPTSSDFLTESESVSSVMTSYQSEILSRSKSFTIPISSTEPTSSDYLTESESVSSVMTSYQSEILSRSKSIVVPLFSTSPTSSYYLTESESVSSVMPSYQSKILSRSKSIAVPLFSTLPTSSDFLTESESVSSVMTSYQSKILSRSKSFAVPLFSTLPTSSYYLTESESVSSVMPSYQSKISSRSKPFTVSLFSTSPTSSFYLTESESVSSVMPSYQSKILSRSKSFAVPLFSTLPTSSYYLTESESVSSVMPSYQSKILSRSKSFAVPLFSTLPTSSYYLTESESVLSVMLSYQSKILSRSKSFAVPLFSTLSTSSDFLTESESVSSVMTSYQSEISSRSKPFTVSLFSTSPTSRNVLTESESVPSVKTSYLSELSFQSMSFTIPIFSSSAHQAPSFALSFGKSSVVSTSARTHSTILTSITTVESADMSFSEIATTVVESINSPTQSISNIFLESVSSLTSTFTEATPFNSLNSLTNTGFITSVESGSSPTPLETDSVVMVTKTSAVTQSSTFSILPTPAFDTSFIEGSSLITSHSEASVSVVSFNMNDSISTSFSPGMSIGTSILEHSQSYRTLYSPITSTFDISSNELMSSYMQSSMTEKEISSTVPVFSKSSFTFLNSSLSTIITSLQENISATSSVSFNDTRTFKTSIESAPITGTLLPSTQLITNSRLAEMTVTESFLTSTYLSSFQNSLTSTAPFYSSLSIINKTSVTSLPLSLLNSSSFTPSFSSTSSFLLSSYNESFETFTANLISSITALYSASVVSTSSVKSSLTLTLSTSVTQEYSYSSSSSSYFIIPSATSSSSSSITSSFEIKPPVSTVSLLLSSTLSQSLPLSSSRLLSSPLLSSLIIPSSTILSATSISSLIMPSFTILSTSSISSSILPSSTLRLASSILTSINNQSLTIISSTTISLIVQNTTVLSSSLSVSTLQSQPSFVVPSATVIPSSSFISSLQPHSSLVVPSATVLLSSSFISSLQPQSSMVVPSATALPSSSFISSLQPLSSLVVSSATILPSSSFISSLKPLSSLGVSSPTVMPSSSFISSLPPLSSLVVSSTIVLQSSSFISSLPPRSSLVVSSTIVLPSSSFISSLPPQSSLVVSSAIVLPSSSFISSLPPQSSLVVSSTTVLQSSSFVSSLPPQSALVVSSTTVLQSSSFVSSLQSHSSLVVSNATLLPSSSYISSLPPSLSSAAVTDVTPSSHSQNHTNSSTFLSSTLSPETITSIYSASTAILSSSIESPLMSPMPSSLLSKSYSVYDTASVSISPTTASVSASVSVTTSSVQVTTGSPPESTTLNATTTRETYWVKTVLKVQRNVNISGHGFKSDLEKSLAEAFNEAFVRKRLIDEGKFDPLDRRRRRKRYTPIGDASVHIRDMTRLSGTTSVTVAYSVEQAGKVMSATAAVESLNVLDTQELAIILRQVVATKAETYIQTEGQNETTTDESQLWLIAIIAGPIAGVIIVVWICVCVYFKCYRKKDEHKIDGEPELTALQHTVEKGDEHPGLSTAADEENAILHVFPRQSSKTSLKKKRNYEVNSFPDQDTLQVEQTTKTKSPVKNKGRASAEKSRHIRSGKVSPTSPKQDILPPRADKAKRSTGNSLDPAAQDRDPMNYNLRTSGHQPDSGNLLQSSISDDNGEIQERMKMERRKNKERLRDKRRRKELAVEDEYTASQNEINAVLGMPSTTLPSVFIESGSPVKESTSSRRDSGIYNGNVSVDENLDEARSRMHKLLDEAFSLISPRSSFTENDLRNTVRSSQMASLSHAKDSGTSGSKSNIPLDPNRGKDIKHEPFYVNPAFSSSHADFPFETWSPYRASDQVALISMPHSIEPTKLGRKSKDDKRPLTSKSQKRPAASFEFPESKSTGQLDDAKYTTSPPKPIILRTKENTNDKTNTSTNNMPGMNGKMGMTGINGDVFLTNSTTSLTRSHPKVSSNSKGNNIEMQQMRSSQNGTDLRHKPPSRDMKNNDEVDIINGIKADANSDNFLQSLRDELELLKGEYNVNTVGNKKKTNKPKVKSMTEIV